MFGIFFVLTRPFPHRPSLASSLPARCFRSAKIVLTAFLIWGMFVPGEQPGSSETALIQAEYAAVDAREKAKAEAEASRRLQGPVRVRLAPSTTALRMPSEG